jgi:preprotein translocase subunit SecD
MKKFLTWRVWLLIIVLIFGVIILEPNPWAKGIEVVSLDSGSDAAKYGLEVGNKIININGESVETFGDVEKYLDEMVYPSQDIFVKTSNGELKYNVTNDIGFIVDENLTILDSSVGLDGTLLEINGEVVEDYETFNEVYSELIPMRTVKIETNKGMIAYMSREVPDITVAEAGKTNLRYGLEFTGGTRVLLKPVAEEITDDDITTLIDVLTNRLNVYGLSDIRIRRASDWEGNKYVLVELAGVTEDEVKNLIAQQGKFEAKIGDDVVFEGGNKDITYVCRNDGSCSGIRSCSESGETQVCKFDFSITLSPEAAQRQADLTSGLDVVTGENGENYLSKSLDLYLDGELVDSLKISESLKGEVATQISISGPGYGNTQSAAIEDATLNMNQLQTILITGSLPYDIQIEKMDTISPAMGETFLKNVITVSLLAILGVGVVIFARYRKWKFVVPVMITLLSELLLILAFAAFVGWNLDMVAIAGILAAIGTGVDDQIVILDEAVHGRKRQVSWKDRLKGAFFIIFSAYAATVAAMVPLWNAGGGLLRGFALTTIIGVTIGVFLTRPAFASIIENIEKSEG